MALRPPGDSHRRLREQTRNDVLGMEIMAEMASSLGRAGEDADKALRRLESLQRDDPLRTEALKSAARAVYAYFIQRELCGLRRHQDAIRDYRIPDEVLVRLGAS